MNAIIFHPFFMLTLGLMTHFAFELGEITATTGKVASPIQYIKERPYRIFMSVVGALVAYAILLDTIPPETINQYRMAIMAFGAGYIADSGVKSAANITRGAIQRGGGQDGAL